MGRSGALSVNICRCDSYHSLHTACFGRGQRWLSPKACPGSDVSMIQTDERPDKSEFCSMRQTLLSESDDIFVPVEESKARQREVLVARYKAGIPGRAVGDI